MTRLAQYENILLNVNRHITLDDNEKDFFISLIQIRNLNKKDFLLKESQICNVATFVNYGCLRSYYEDDSGTHIIQFAVDNWWIGDLKSYVKGTRASMNIDALMKTQVFQISKINIEKLYQKVPKFERFFRILMENSLVGHQDRIIQSQTLKTKMRYENFVKTHPYFHKHIPLKDIANYLGVTPEHLSTIRAKN